MKKESVLNYQMKISTILSSVLVIMILTGLLSQSMDIHYLINTSTAHSTPQRVTMTQYQRHDPILIDDEVPSMTFSTIATNEGWDGDGSQNNPFIISGLNITGPTTSSLIEIRNVGVYFQINNCLLIGGKNGIVLSDSGVYYPAFPAFVISHNIILGNVEHGMVLGCNFTKIECNTISNNGADGIHSDGIFMTSVSCNKLLNNSGYGLTIHGQMVNITCNSFIDNNLGGASQAFDDGSENVFDYNYWNDWANQKEDADSNGILDDPYPIEGNINNQDDHPRVSCCMPVLTQVITTTETILTTTSEPSGFEGAFVVLGFFSLVLATLWRRRRRQIRS